MLKQSSSQYPSLEGQQPMPQPFPSLRLCYCPSPRRASESASFLLQWDYCQECEIYGAKRRPNKTATAQQLGCCFPGLSVFSHMSCKLKQINWLEPASHWKHKEYIPHESTVLGTHRPTLELWGTERWQVSPVCTRDLGARAECSALQNRVHLQMPVRVCHTNPATRKGLRKGEIQKYGLFWVLSAIPILPEVGTLETPQHMTVLTKVTWSKKKYLYIYIHKDT